MHNEIQWTESCTSTIYFKLLRPFASGAFGGPPPATQPFAHFPAPQAPGSLTTWIL